MLVEGYFQKLTGLVPPAPDFNGAAIITEDGLEIPITEAMVQHALNTMADWPTELGGPRPAAPPR